MALQVGDQDDSAELSEINIVPLVDVMLVLLIIFMIAAAPALSGIDVNLPTSQARGSGSLADRIVLSIDAKGDYYIEKDQVPAAALGEKIKTIFEFRDQKEIFIRADRAVDYGRVVDAMNAAKLAGIGRMSMLTEPPKTVAKAL